MKEHYYLDDCNDDGVLSFYGGFLLKVGTLRQVLKEAWAKEIPDALDNVLKKNLSLEKFDFGARYSFGQGINCEILRLSADKRQNKNQSECRILSR
jgi:hypothetical protein